MSGHRSPCAVESYPACRQRSLPPCTEGMEGFLLSFARATARSSRRTGLTARSGCGPGVGKEALLPRWRDVTLVRCRMGDGVTPSKEGLSVLPYPAWLNAGDNAWQLTAATLVG